jgi:hypothetical protein
MSAQDKILKLKINSLIRERKYLQETFSEMQDLFSIYDKELTSIISDLCELEIDNYSLHKKNEEITKRSIEVENIPEEIDNLESVPKWVKRIYRKIALKSHPDKIQHLEISKEEKEYLEESFKHAFNCLEEEKYEDLLTLALELEIDLEVLGEDQINILEKSNKNTRKEIQEMQNLAPWMWGSIPNSDIPKKINLALFVWESLKLGNISKESVEAYLSYYYEYGDSKKWRKEVLLNKKKPSNRKTGSRPHKRISQIRKD